MKGSVYKRCKCPVERDTKGRRKACRKPHGSWVFVADMGIDPASGKRRQVRKSGFRNSDEAEAALAKFLTEVDTGQVAHDAKQTVEQYLRSWLEAKRDSGTRPTTMRSYTQHVDGYLVPHLGRLRLGDLRAQHIEKMLRDIAKPIDGKALSPATVRRVHATLRSALTSAKRKHLVAFNAAENLELPRAPRPQVRPWEPAELGVFLDHAATDRLGPLYEVMAMTGLRRGEACGLRWDDIDFERRRITVRQQIVDGVKGVECPYCKKTHARTAFGAPKTASGENRVVDLDEATSGALLAQQMIVATEREQWGDAYNDHGLVFPREDGTPLSPQYISDTFKRLAANAGLRPIRLHDLRHGQASLMLAAGVPLAVVSKRLGHSTIGITADTYSHLLEGVGAQAAAAAAALVPRSGRDRETPRDHDVTTSENPQRDSEARTTSDAGQSGSESAPSRTRTDTVRILSPLPLPIGL
jgi:integrase